MRPAVRFHLLVFSALFVLGSGHLIAVVRRAILRGELFRYDFRFYSLLLVGLLLVVPSVLGLRQVRGLRRGLPEARRRALQLSALVLVVNLPLIPTEFHTFPYTSFEAANGMIAFGTIVSLLATANSGVLFLSQPASSAA